MAVAKFSIETMKHDFRGRAKSCLQSARDELSSGCDNRIRYAALELRFCIEALTYDRAQNYSEDLPPAEFLKWQPKKLLETLLEIEPLADTGGQLHFKEIAAAGEAEHPWHGLGEERVFTLQAIKKSYDSLGSYLHHPTLHQLNEDKVDFAGMRAKCLKILEELDSALSSTIYNINLKSHANFVCSQCESNVRKRLRMDGAPVEAVCQNCGAMYKVSRKEETKINCQRLGVDFRCRTKDCGQELFIPREKIFAGSKFKCSGCQAHFRIDLAVIPQIDNSDKNTHPNR